MGNLIRRGSRRSRQLDRDIRFAEHPFRLEVERVKCNAICALDGALADPKVRGNFLAGFLDDAAHNEHEATKDVESSRQNIRFFDEKLKIFR